jgi:sterol desaturase/sphingolipid hydroxylase (fatty acid hydroxylase superfamily)
MDLAQVRILTTGIIVAAALVLVLLERRFPYLANQKILREGFLNDFVFYNFLQTYLLGLIISIIIDFIDRNTNISRLQLISHWDVWVQLLFFLVTHDFYIYWFHRWQHNSKFLWRLHEAHHSPCQVDWLSGVRSHSLEILINQTVEFLPIILLGAAPEVALFKGAVSAVWGMYIHSNLNISSGLLQHLINGPEMHRWYHAEDKRVYFQNYATKLAVWDWIFNTAYLPKGKKPEKYGLPYQFPDNYFMQHLYAFRKFEKPIS